MQKIIVIITLFICYANFGSHADNMSSQMLQLKPSIKSIIKHFHPNHKRNVKSGAFIKIDNESILDSIQEIGGIINYKIGNIAYVSFYDYTYKSSKIKNIIMINNRLSYPTMDLAREVTNVSELHQGIEIESDIIPFTGKDVIIGIVDGGIQPSHIAFTNEFGETRIKKFIMTESSNESESEEFVSTIYDTPESIITAPTDTACIGHGTHTASSAAGRHINQFGGIAPDADLILTTMGEKLYEDEIMYGIHSAFQYADSVGKPIVVSLSLGSALGPQDGTGLITDYMQEINPCGNIICFSAGNDGNSLLSLQQDFKSNPKPLYSAFARTNYGTPAKQLYAQLWSDDDTELEFALHVINTKTQEIIFSTDYFSISETGEQLAEGMIVFANDYEDTLLYPQFADFFEGYIIIAAGNYAPNDRYVAEIQASFPNIDTQSEYALAFSAKSDKGANMTAIANYQNCFFKSYGLKDFTTGNSLNSISDYCTSPYVVSVGAWNGRLKWTDINSVEHSLNQDYYNIYNGVASYSSYGKNRFRGNINLPHVLAPGTEVIAAIPNNINNKDERCFVQTIDDTIYYWGNKTGTSMACPIAAGVIALWLEAKPDLTRDQIIEIIESTSTIDNYIRYDTNKIGNGKIDAYAGLRYIFTQFCDIDNHTLNKDCKLIARHITNDKLEIVISKPINDANLRIYSIDGTNIYANKFSGSQIIIDKPKLSGLYILQIKTTTSTLIHKILID